MIMYNSTNHILSMIFKGFLVATISFLNGLCEQNSKQSTKNLCRKKAIRACTNLFLKWKSVKSETKAQQNIALPILLYYKETI